MWSPEHLSFKYYQTLKPSMAPDSVVRDAATNYYQVTRADYDRMTVSWGQAVWDSKVWYEHHFIKGKDCTTRIMLKDEYKYGRTIRTPDRYYSWILDIEKWIVEYDNNGSKEIQTPEEHGFIKGDVITHLGVIEEIGTSHTCFYNDTTALLYKVIYKPIYKDGRVTAYDEYVIGSPIAACTERIRLPRMHKFETECLVELLKGSKFAPNSLEIDFDKIHFNSIENMVINAIKNDFVHILDFDKIGNSIGTFNIDDFNVHINTRERMIAINLKTAQEKKRLDNIEKFNNGTGNFELFFALESGVLRFFGEVPSNKYVAISGAPSEEQHNDIKSYYNVLRTGWVNGVKYVDVCLRSMGNECLTDWCGGRVDMKFTKIVEIRGGFGFLFGLKDREKSN